MTHRTFRFAAAFAIAAFPFAPLAARAAAYQGHPNPAYPDGTGNDEVEQLNQAQLNGTGAVPAPPPAPYRGSAYGAPAYGAPAYGAPPYGAPAGLPPFATRPAAAPGYPPPPPGYYDPGAPPPPPPPGYGYGAPRPGFGAAAAGLPPYGAPPAGAVPPPPGFAAGY